MPDLTRPPPPQRPPQEDPITAAAFAVIHGFPVVMPYVLVFGITAGWLRERTGSVAASRVRGVARRASGRDAAPRATLRPSSALERGRTSPWTWTARNVPSVALIMLILVLGHLPPVPT